MKQIDMKSFVNELEKISAHKCRSGSTPIRVHNLAQKQVYDGRAKTQMKLSFVQLAKDLMGGKHPLVGKAKNLALVGGGAAGALALQQGYEDWRLGRQVRKAQGM